MVSIERRRACDDAAKKPKPELGVVAHGVQDGFGREQDERSSR